MASGLHAVKGKQIVFAVDQGYLLVRRDWCL
jgi:hypothetical protein